ncbi:MAG TPA: amidohydrolase [Firmicutes bacterium]|jgi:predicted TIM-barrel fold metal-dependent hydrolase|nr:amidohydrolase [Bacillota bacterium]
MGSPVIDFHLHPVHYEYYGESTLNWIKTIHAEKKWEEFYASFRDPNYFVQYLKTSGIDYGVVLAELSHAVTGVCTNEYVLEFCHGQEMLIPFASINPFTTVNMAKELQRLVEEGFRGLKMYPTYQHFYPNDASLYPLYSRAEELQIPVMFHTGSSVFEGARLKYGDPLYLDDVAVDFPKMKIVLVHGGRGFWYDRAYFLAKLHANVYVEIAGLPPRKLMHYFPELEKIGHKVIFGSDWPGVKEIKQNVHDIRQLPLSEKVKERILGGTALTLLNL